MKNRDPQLETSGDPIGFYEREFYPLSNFSSFKVEWKGRVWTTSEHAYQASGFLESAPEIAEEIFNAFSADQAFKIARKNLEKKDPEFDSKKIAIMEDICTHKLKQNPYVERKLLQTGNLKLVEDSPKDAFWGWGPNKDGRNELGKIWMRIREKLQK